MSVRWLGSFQRPGPLFRPRPVIQAADEVVEGSPLVPLIEGRDFCLMQNDQCLVHAADERLFQHHRQDLALPAIQACEQDIRGVLVWHVS